MVTKQACADALTHLRNIRSMTVKTPDRHCAVSLTHIESFIQAVAASLKEEAAFDAEKNRKEVEEAAKRGFGVSGDSNQQAE